MLMQEFDRPSDPRPLPRKSREELGRSARSSRPLEDHAALGPAERDPIAILEHQALSRVPGLVGLRYARMATSPFAFYRGAAAIMAGDLRELPDSGVQTQLCGDAHLSNVGFYASPERALVIDLNDFDETAPGPFEWDVKRMAASFEIAARSRGFDDGDRSAIVERVGRAYAAAMDTAVRTPALELFTAPVVEVHLSNIEKREEWRRFSVLEDVVAARFIGKGPDGYREAIGFLVAGHE